MHMQRSLCRRVLGGLKGNQCRAVDASGTMEILVFLSYKEAGEEGWRRALLLQCCCGAGVEGEGVRSKLPQEPLVRAEDPCPSSLDAFWLIRSWRHSRRPTGYKCNIAATFCNHALISCQLNWASALSVILGRPRWHPGQTVSLMVCLLCLVPKPVCVSTPGPLRMDGL